MYLQFRPNKCNDFKTAVFVRSILLAVGNVRLNRLSLVTSSSVFFLKIYCSELYKCLHEFPYKTVPDTSLHKMSDLIEAIEVYYVETTFTLKAVKKLSLQQEKTLQYQGRR